MNLYLLDTNILLRIADTSSPQHPLALAAITNILSKGDKCVITSQVLIEFWVVATRPVEVNGLGWNTQLTTEKMRQFIAQFRILKETQEIFTNWFKLVTTHNIRGKRTHDVRLLAIMTVYNIPYLLTLNPNDFIPVPDITIIQPQDLLEN
jgi:predicted nucleic acid-binding protein